MQKVRDSTMKINIFIMIVFICFLSTEISQASGEPEKAVKLITPEIQNALLACQEESSPLPRLQCYDNAWHPELKSSQKDKPDRYWWQITGQEQARKATDNVLLVRTIQSDGQPSALMLTVPGNGNYPARAIFAISCIENITRMQLAFTTPQGKGDQTLHLYADGKDIPGRWFWRGSGYRLETSRGLQGISEIQQLLDAKEVSISAEHPAVNGLHFRIDGLRAAIEPLRKACHW